jgi:hypothetical protein
LKICELFISGAVFGIIWLVQCLLYPGFLYLDKMTFPQAMIHHQKKISLVIVPLMLSELIIASWPIFTKFSASQVFILILVLLIWFITFTVQVPLHQKLLNEGFNEARIRKLVRTNWGRTIL